MRYFLGGVGDKVKKWRPRFVQSRRWMVWVCQNAAEQWPFMDCCLLQKFFISKPPHRFLQQNPGEYRTNHAKAQQNPDIHEKNTSKLPHDQQKQWKEQENGNLLRFLHTLRLGRTSDDKGNGNQGDRRRHQQQDHQPADAGKQQSTHKEKQFCFDNKEHSHE